ncbi:MAG: hypothetical protein VKS61_17250 [Candidatus Sericytochromatia bacterium]|nr:hypothetical protein [Candidatus Sericytochromatia bacterium]
MTPGRARPIPLLLATSVAVTAASGCWSTPVMPGPSAAPTAVASPRPVASTPPPKPSPTPTPKPAASAGADEDAGAFDLAAPLPSASVDSTLEATEDQLVSAALSSDELAAYMQTDLIHDGGVVLYRTLAAPLVASGRRLEGDGGRKPPSPVGRKPPMQRQLERKGEPELSLRQACDAGEDCKAGRRRVRAAVTVRQVVRAQLTDTTGATVTKRYAEVFLREVVLGPKAGKMSLEAIGPLMLRAAGDARGLEMREVALSLQDGLPLLAWRAGDRPTPVAQLPVLAAGGTLRVRVRIDQARPSGLVVLAGFPGQKWDERVKLVASGVDTATGEYSGSVTVPARQGATHLLIEAVDARSLEPAGAYRSVGLGFSGRVGAP